MGFDQIDERLHSPVPTIQPPRFLYVDEDGIPVTEKKITVINEHYNEFVGLLSGGKGYEALLRIEQRLEEHSEEANREVERHKSRLHFCQNQADGIGQRIQQIAQSESNEEEEFEQVVEDVLERRLVDHWSKLPKASWGISRRDEDTSQETPKMEEVLTSAHQVFGDAPSGGSGPTDEDSPRDRSREKEWYLYEDEAYEEESTPAKLAMLIKYTPESGSFNREYDDDHLEESDQLVFRGHRTWDEALSYAKRRLRSRAEKYEKIRRTAEVLRFRLTTLRTVLYRFEAFGLVEQMDREEARRHVEKGLPDIFKGRPTLRQHAERIIEKYRSAPRDLPTTMSELKGWIGAEGENAVMQLQARIREAGLSDEIPSGEPEAFCSMVEDLYDVHFNPPQDA